MSPRRLVRGVTLIELLVTMIIMVVLASIAVPSFQRQMAASRLNGAANELMASLTRTRAESMRLGSRVTACKSEGSQTACSSSGTAGWEGGWLVFQDPTRVSANAYGTVDAGETITFIVQPLPPDILATGSGDVANHVSFSSDGRSKTYAGASQTGTIRVCSTSGALDDSNRARDITLSATGQLRIIMPAAAVDATCPAP